MLTPATVANEVGEPAQHPFYWMSLSLIEFSFKVSSSSVPSSTAVCRDRSCAPGTNCENTGGGVWGREEEEEG